MLRVLYAFSQRTITHPKNMIFILRLKLCLEVEVRQIQPQKKM